jgi:hypothetical protein
MKRLTPCALVTTAVLLVLGDGRASAGFVDFSYHWSVTPGSVIPGGTGSVTLALAADGLLTAQTGLPAFIEAATLTTTSSATTPPDVFNAPFALTLDLTDVASSATGTLSFAGTITGLLTANSSTLTSTFSEPVTQTLDLGQYRYSVTIDPIEASLPAPGSQFSTLLDALVTVTEKPTTTPPPGSDTPEPSSLVLGGVAVALMLTQRGFRRSGRRAQQ